MGFISLLKHAPFIGKKLRKIRPSVQDVLYTFYDASTAMKFVDVGANTGQTIDFIGSKFPASTLYSFEPTPSLFKDLTAKYGNRSRVNLFQLALSDKDGNLDFFLSENSPTNSCLQPNTELYASLNSPLTASLKESQKISVPAVTFDQWYHNHQQIGDIDLMKIDTQGYEYNVIAGGINTLQQHVKLLYFEIQYLDFYKGAVPFYKIFELLYQNGFYFYCNLSSNKRNTHQVLESDVLFVNQRFFKI